jgi:CBS domain-containing protein
MIAAVTRRLENGFVSGQGSDGAASALSGGGYRNDVGGGGAVERALYRPAGDRQIGFVSEQDCLRHLLVSSYHQEGSLRVEELMHDQPLTVREDDSVVDVAGLMVKQKPKIYPVLDSGDRLVGLLTRRAVLQALNDSRRGD